MTAKSERGEASAGAAADGLIDAVVQDGYGEPGEVLRPGRIAPPAVGDEDVLIRVRAAGVDQGTWHLISGMPLAVRLAGYGLRAPKNPVPGLDVAGVVERVGAGVEGFSPGDEVFGIARGSYAELTAAPAAKLALKPAGLSFAAAAATPVSGLAALQAVRDHGRVAEGQRVIVLGASGGVGSFATQIAKARGAQVTGVCSGGSVEFVRSLGADEVIDYERERIGAGGRSWDVIIDTGGNRPLRELRSALSAEGSLVIVGGEGAGGRLLGGSSRQLRAILLSPFTSQDLGTFISSENAADLRELAGLIESGEVSPAIGRTYPLADAARAIADLRAGGARGKLVLEL